MNINNLYQENDSLFNQAQTELYALISTTDTMKKIDKFGIVLCRKNIQLAVFV